MGNAVRELREALELRFPDAMPVARGLAPTVRTGVSVLDGALPNRGLPRGCLTVWRGGAASSALLRSACVETVGRGERAVWVDGARVVQGDFWPAGVMVVRPGCRASDSGRSPSGFGRQGEPALLALSAAEELLRCGGFALVVVTGVPGGVEAELVRLSRVAREGGGALVAVEQGSGPGRRASSGGAVSAARLRVESWYRPEGHVWRRGVFGEPVEVETMGVAARVTGTGWLRSVDFQLPVREQANRLSPDAGLVDRRGVRPRRPVAGMDLRLQREVEPVAHPPALPVSHGGGARRRLRGVRGRTGGDITVG